MVWAVSLLPVPATTGARPSTARTTVRNMAVFSASLRVGDSPVVPPTTNPSEPLSSRKAASASRRS